MLACDIRLAELPNGCVRARYKRSLNNLVTDLRQRVPSFLFGTVPTPNLPTSACFRIFARIDCQLIPDDAFARAPVPDHEFLNLRWQLLSGQCHASLSPIASASSLAIYSATALSVTNRRRPIRTDLSWPEPINS
ncbi:Uncharacterised protein [Mycobacteroides abscessus subsp. abscessus]|nr:Uncharacterised protein [Mycobacteroides abscessus subsp. abscessus]SLF22878.1 Uncharacterised protein [Mycobacteroides abscessus subsp. abscessus]SLF82153.1 Uncharacterised protein [Mycobacteroides abscessus subsp. abscessus]SLG67165.1 Uncharacterised protein [Mycobacteroides abscessus subsp. abscessus]